MMRMKHYWKDRLTIKIFRGIAIVLAVLLGIMLWLNWRNEKEIEQVIARMYEELRPLSSERYRLEEQVGKLQSEKEKFALGQATMQFLMNDLSERAYKEIISPMSEYDYPVAIGVSVEQMPGVEGNISVEVTEELIDKGWYLCYSFAKDEVSAYHTQEDRALSLWLDAVRSEADTKGLAVCNAIYFPAGTFREDYVGVLKEHDIEVVIHAGNIGKKLLAAECEQDIWYVGGIWWRGNEILANKLSSIQHSGGEFVTIMGVDDTATDSLKDWMSQFQGIAKAVSVTDFAAMAQIQEENRELAVEEDTVLEKEINSLLSELEVIEAQMDEIRNQYMEKIRGMQQTL